MRARATAAAAMATEEADLYRAFVERTMNEVACGLQLDNSLGKKGAIVAAFQRRKEALRANNNQTLNAAQLVLEGRFLLGADDAAYLSSGLGLLWSTVGDKGCLGDQSELALAPPDLYTPETTSGIRRGLLDAMRRRHSANKEEAPENLRRLLEAIQTLLPIQAIAASLYDASVGNPVQAFARTVTDVKSEDAAVARDARREVARILIRLDAFLNGRAGNQDLSKSILNAQRKQIAACKDELSRTKDDLSTAQDEAEAAQARFAKTAQERQDLTSALNRTKAELATRNADAQEAATRAEEAATRAAEELEAAQARYAKVAQERQDLTSALNRSKAELAAKNAAAQEAATKLAEANRKLEVAAQEKQAILASLDRCNAALEQAAASAQAERARAAEELRQARTTAGEQAAAARREQEAAAAAAAEAQRVAVEAAREEERQRGAAAAAADKAAALDALRQEKERDVAEVERGLAELLQRIAQAEGDASATAEALRATVATREEELRTERASRQAEVRELTQQRDAAQDAERLATTARDEATASAAAARQRSLDAQAKERQATERSATAAAAVTAAQTARRDAEAARDRAVAEKTAAERNAEANVAAAREALRRCEEREGQLRTQLATVTASERAASAAATEARAECARLRNEAEMTAAQERVQGSAELSRLAEWARSLKRGLTSEEFITRLKQAGILGFTFATTSALAYYAFSLYEQIHEDDLTHNDAGLWAFSKQVFNDIYDKALEIYNRTPGSLTEDEQAAEAARVVSNVEGSVGDDPDVATAVLRGLVGQRGPTEPAAIAQCAHDALLPYALPSAEALAKAREAAQRVLDHTEAPTEAEVARALGACHAMLRPDGAKRQRRAAVLEGVCASPITVAEALAALNGDFAITGTEPADASDPRQGVEMPHEVRWMPQGSRARTMARVAVLEHAIARCTQVADRKSTSAPVVAVLRAAAATLKLQQLEPLYALKEAAAFDDHPHPLGTATPLVTRPCAVVRGVLSFPTDAGVAPRPSEQVGTGLASTDTARLEQAMSKTTAATAALRNERRRAKAASHFYVAPPADALAYQPVPTGASAALNAQLADIKQVLNNLLAQTPPPWNAAAIRGVLADPLANGPVGDEDARRLIRSMTAERDAAIQGPPQRSAAALAAAPAAAPAAGTSTQTGDDDVAEDLTSMDLSVHEWQTYVRRGLVFLATLDAEDADNPEQPDAVEAFLDAQADDPGGSNAHTRREGLWTEFHRHVAISQDRLWVFVRLMSGGIGGDISEVITMADEASLAASKAIQQQRVEISKRVSDMQAKIVETVVGSMLKSSNLTVDLERDNLTVIDAEAKKKLQDIAAGTSGRPFFEANVAMRNLTDDRVPATTLSQVLKSLASAGMQMQTTLEAGLAEPGAASASLAELSHPSNSYFVSIRTDAMAAIREAHERLNCELGIQGYPRRLALWELVEGGCHVLTTRFADFCGYLLVQKRSSTGVSAMYVSHLNIRTNATQARIALARLVAAAGTYVGRVSLPEFGDANPQEARWKAIAAAEKVADRDVVSRPWMLVRSPLAAEIAPEGWTVIGGRR